MIHIFWISSSLIYIQFDVTIIPRTFWMCALITSIVPPQNIMIYMVMSLSIICVYICMCVCVCCCKHNNIFVIYIYIYIWICFSLASIPSDCTLFETRGHFNQIPLERGRKKKLGDGSLDCQIPLVKESTIQVTQMKLPASSCFHSDVFVRSNI